MKLLDTDVCIEILRGNASVIHRRAQTRAKIATTSITACELYYGAFKSDLPAEKRSVADEFLTTLPVLHVTPAATRLISADSKPHWRPPVAGSSMPIY